MNTQGKSAGAERGGKAPAQFYRQDGERFVGVPVALIESGAFAGLSMAARVILVDMILENDLAAHKGKDSFGYSWGTCRIPCAENTFYPAMKELEGQGFIESNRRGRGRITYRRSDLWRYAAHDEDAARRKEAKRKRLDRATARKPAYLDYCGTSTRKKCGVPRSSQDRDLAPSEQHHAEPLLDKTGRLPRNERELAAEECRRLAADYLERYRAEGGRSRIPIKKVAEIIQRHGVRRCQELLPEVLRSWEALGTITRPRSRRRGSGVSAQAR